MEWIIVDESPTDKIHELVKQSNLSPIRTKYVSVKNEKMPLGQKRNFMHTFATGDIFVYFDDDDFHHKNRVEHSVQMLFQSDCLIAGASQLFVYFNHISQMIQFGPYNVFGPFHATAGTFAFKRELLNVTKYNDTAVKSEEYEFLKKYTIPLIQLDPMKTILVFPHSLNTCDKRILLKTQTTEYVKQSDKTVDEFIFGPKKQWFVDFYTKEMDALLLQSSSTNFASPPFASSATHLFSGITMHNQNGVPIQLTAENILYVIQELQKEIKRCHTRIAELEKN
jgi:glycosyltransferase involved in cell wall biosynthesis